MKFKVVNRDFKNLVLQMWVLKNLLFSLFIFFISLSSLYSATQLEEGFRWRSSVDFIEIQRDLEEMSKVEKLWSAFLKENYRYKNIALVRMGVFYKAEGSIHYRSGWVKVPYQGVFTDKIPIFTSGSTQNIFDHLEALYLDRLHTFSNHILLDADKDNFIVINGYEADKYTWYSNLKSLYKKERKSSTQRLIDPALTLQRLENQDLSERDFDTLYAHSEQWILYHLFSEDTLEENLKRLKQTLPLNSSIQRIVLQIHTNRDACDVCAQTISIFTRHLKKTSTKVLKGALPHDPLIIVSSRTGYQERRSIAGHDGHAADQASVEDQSGLVKHIIIPDPPMQITENTLQYKP